MLIDEEVLESSAQVNALGRRPNRRRGIVIGAACLVVAGATVFALVDGSGVSDSRDVPRITVDLTVRDAGSEQGVAEPNPVQPGRSRDDVVRDLVHRGVVPAATLDDGTQITRPGLQPTRTRDEIVRDLVERGLVPAATLGDGTQVARLALNPRRNLDDVIRNLVARGLVPAATLEDGTQITRP